MCLDWKHLEEESIFSISHMCSRWMTYTVIQGRSRQLGQRSLTCCGSWGRRVRRDWATEQQEQLSVVHKIACTSEQRQKLEEKEDFSTIFLSVKCAYFWTQLIENSSLVDNNTSTKRYVYKGIHFIALLNITKTWNINNDTHRSWHTTQSFEWWCRFILIDTEMCPHEKK